MIQKKRSSKQPVVAGTRPEEEVIKCNAGASHFSYILIKEKKDGYFIHQIKHILVNIAFPLQDFSHW